MTQDHLDKYRIPRNCHALDHPLHTLSSYSKEYFMIHMNFIDTTFHSYNHSFTQTGSKPLSTLNLTPNLKSNIENSSKNLSQKVWPPYLNSKTPQAPKWLHCKNSNENIIQSLR